MDSMRHDLASKPHILVVCTGNICRSPMGEVVLRARIEEAGLPYAVSSCGVSDEEHGRPIDASAARALREAGYQVPAHRAHRAARGELEGSGLILAMTTGHARALRRVCEQAGVPVSRIHLWREFDGSGLGIVPEGCFGDGGALADARGQRRHSDFYYSYGEYDVVDPWGGGRADFAQTLDVVERGAAGIVAALEADAELEA